MMPECQSDSSDWHFSLGFGGSIFGVVINISVPSNLEARRLSIAHGEQVKPGSFFALVRELLSLAHCAASGANGEAGPKGERRRRESRK
jgi:hypothetical protein